MTAPWKRGGLVLLVVLAALAAPGCRGLPAADHERLRMNLETVVRTLRDSGAEAEAELFLSPNGSLNLGPGATYSNASYLKVRVRVDPGRAP